MAYLTLDVNQAAVRTHDVVYRGQPNARPLADLGCKKWLEQMCTDPLIHTHTVIFDGEKRAQKASLFGAALAFLGEDLHLAVAGLNRDMSPVRQCVSGVEHEVEKNLLRLHGTHLDQA